VEGGGGGKIVWGKTLRSGWGERAKEGGKKEKGITCMGRITGSEGTFLPKMRRKTSKNRFRGEGFYGGKGEEDSKMKGVAYLLGKGFQGGKDAKWVGEGLIKRFEPGIKNRILYGGKKEKY